MCVSGVGGGGARLEGLDVGPGEQQAVPAHQQDVLLADVVGEEEAADHLPEDGGFRRRAARRVAAGDGRPP